MTQLRFAAQMDAAGMTQALEVLQQRFCNLVRARAVNGDSPDLNESASALSLVTFGHNATVEGYLRIAARQTADRIDPALDDAGVMAIFASNLPLAVGDVPVREMFTPAR